MLDDLVTVSITTATAQVTRAGFGVPLIAAYHTNYTARVREYSAASALTQMVTEGFSTSSVAYKAMSSILAQNPRVQKVKIGRRDNSWTQIVRVTPTTVANAAIYAGTVAGLAWTFTSDADASLAEICTGVAAAITALAGVSASGASGTHVDVTADAALTLHAFTFTTDNLTHEDVSVDANMADDLSAIRLADADWYGLVIDSQTSAEIEEAADWAETQKVIHLAQCADDTMLDAAVTTDLGSSLQDEGYARTGLVYHADPDSFACAAWLGRMLPTDPGSATWKFKTLRSTAVSVLRSDQDTALKNKNVNRYQTIAGVAMTAEGVSSSGEFLDVTIFVDWLAARIQEHVFTLMVNTPKLGYTDESVDLIKAEITAVGEDGIAAGGLVKGSFVVTAPLVATISDADKAARLLPDVSFSGTLAGAIHATQIQGTLSV